MASLFSKIVAGEIPCHKVAENKDFLAFLDINPLVRGHTLVIPKEEIDYIFNLPPQLYQGLFGFVREVGQAVEAAIPCQRIGLSVVGLEIPHCHVHVVPLNNMGDLNFTRPKLQLGDEELARIAAQIQEKLPT